MTNAKEEFMWTHLLIIFRTALNFELRDGGLCLTLPHHVRVTLGKALSVLQPRVLSLRSYIRIKEANVYKSTL